MKESIKGKKIGEVKYYALQAKDGHLAGSVDGSIMVCTHKLKAKGYKCVELVIK